MWKHKMEMMNDDENVVIENINLPIFAEPYNNNNNTRNDDVNIFHFMKKKMHMPI